MSCFVLVAHCATGKQTNCTTVCVPDVVQAVVIAALAEGGDQEDEAAEKAMVKQERGAGEASPSQGEDEEKSDGGTTLQAGLYVESEFRLHVRSGLRVKVGAWLVGGGVGGGNLSRQNIDRMSREGGAKRAWGGGYS